MDKQTIKATLDGGHEKQNGEKEEAREGQEPSKNRKRKWAQESKTGKEMDV